MSLQPYWHLISKKTYHDKGTVAPPADAEAIHSPEPQSYSMMHSQSICCAIDRRDNKDGSCTNNHREVKLSCSMSIRGDLQVQTDEYGFALEPLVPGQLMARHYIRFKTMVAMCNTPSPAGLPQLLMTIARSAEFSGIKLRRSEKKPLNAINKGSGPEKGKSHAVRFCVPDPHKPQKTKERISTGAEKIFIMVQ